MYFCDNWSHSILHLSTGEMQQKVVQTQRLGSTSFGGGGHDLGETCEGAAPWLPVHYLPGASLQLVRCPQETSHHHLLLPSWKPHPGCAAVGFEDNTTSQFLIVRPHCTHAVRFINLLPEAQTSSGFTRHCTGGFNTLSAFSKITT